MEINRAVIQRRREKKEEEEEDMKRNGRPTFNLRWADLVLDPDPDNGAVEDAALSRGLLERGGHQRLGPLLRRPEPWQEVADALNDRHRHTKKTWSTDAQCKNMIDTLKKKYKVEKARVSESDGAV